MSVFSFYISYINTYSPGPDISNQMAAVSRSFLPGVTLCQPVTIGALKLLAREKDSRVTSCCGNSWLARLWTVCVHVNNRGRITWMRANPSLDRFHFFFFIRVLRARVDVCMDRKNNLLTLKALDPYPKNKKNKKKKKEKHFTLRLIAMFQKTRVYAFTRKRKDNWHRVKSLGLREE